MQIALHADQHQEKGAGVNWLEAKAGEQAVEERKEGPVCISLHYLEGQDDQKDNVEHGQVQQDDVSGGWILMYFLQKCIEDQEVGL